MSGIYLTVWDDNKEFDRVLQPTRGGWPHVTLAWMGKTVSHGELKEVAREVVNYWFLRPLTISHARVNTFFHEKSGKDRHDVLLVIDKDGAKQVEDARNVLIKTRFPERQAKFNMMEPHITAKSCWTVDEAKAECERINKLLPLVVTVKGVTI